MSVGRGFHVLGDEVPGVRDGSAGKVFRGPEQFGGKFLEAAGVVGLKLGTLGKGLNQFFAEFAALIIKEIQLFKNKDGEESYDNPLYCLWERNNKKLNNDNEDALQKILPYNYT